MLTNTKWKGGNVAIWAKREQFEGWWRSEVYSALKVPHCRTWFLLPWCVRQLQKYSNVRARDLPRKAQQTTEQTRVQLRYAHAYCHRYRLVVVFDYAFLEEWKRSRKRLFDAGIHGGMPLRWMVSIPMNYCCVYCQIPKQASCCSSGFTKTFNKLYLFSPWQHLKRASCCSSGLTKTFFL